jgi:hypothetical protein
MTKPIFYFEYAKTVFMPLRYLYAECMVLIEESRLYPLICLRESCHRDRNCMGVLARRVQFFFEEVSPHCEMIVAYYKWKDKPNSIRAGLFTPDLGEPRQITCNKAAFKRFQRKGDTYKWDPPASFYLLGGGPPIVPVEGLIVPAGPEGSE